MYIFCDRREVLLPWPTSRPERFIIRRSRVGRGPQEYSEEVKEFPIDGIGLYWEADAVARDIRGKSCQSYGSASTELRAGSDGRIENERMPHGETLLELAIFDEIRRQGGYEFPEGLEKVKGSV